MANHLESVGWMSAERIKAGKEVMVKWLHRIECCAWGELRGLSRLAKSTYCSCAQEGQQNEV